MPPAAARDTRAIVEAMVAALNTGRAEKVAQCMHPEGVFVGPLGDRTEGRAAMTERWRDYFRLVRDYRIEIETLMIEGQDALLCGTARGTVHRGGMAVAGGDWQAPAAWRATSDGSRLTLWQVYADNQPLRRLLRGTGELAWVTGDAG
jgi:uncharacterized protein (TIGR02246 family)